jgi:hypothetical protein
LARLLFGPKIRDSLWPKNHALRVVKLAHVQPKLFDRGFGHAARCNSTSDFPHRLRPLSTPSRCGSFTDRDSDNATLEVYWWWWAAPSLLESNAAPQLPRPALYVGAPTSSQTPAALRAYVVDSSAPNGFASCSASCLRHVSMP